MILSDRDLQALLDEGRLVIEPYDPSALQPSSIDLRVAAQFRVFANHRYPYIDVRQPMEGLTELVEASQEEPFILHPGEFVLGTTLERVTLPDDMVGRLEGKSSLGRLGLLIHSSLPGSEPVLFRRDGRLAPRRIDEIVGERLDGEVVGFDPDTLEVGYHAVTGWYEGPPDRIFEIVLASGRRVRVTGGHNLFTLDGAGRSARVRTNQLVPGTAVAAHDLDPLLLGTASHRRPALAVGPARDGRPAHQTLREPAPPTDGLQWDTVAEVRDTGSVEPVYDLEVRPRGRRIENFLAGHGGVFVSNTAGFVDPGWSGNLTLELSNVANLPITIYPGMKVGQLCLLRMSSAAERPYGASDRDSKYQGQVGPTPSRYFRNFDPPEDAPEGPSPGP